MNRLTWQFDLNARREGPCELDNLAIDAVGPDGTVTELGTHDFEGFLDALVPDIITWTLPTVAAAAVVVGTAHEQHTAWCCRS